MTSDAGGHVPLCHPRLHHIGRPMPPTSGSRVMANLWPLDVISTWPPAARTALVATPRDRGGLRVGGFWAHDITPHTTPSSLGALWGDAVRSVPGGSTFWVLALASLDGSLVHWTMVFSLLSIISSSNQMSLYKREPAPGSLESGFAGAGYMVWTGSSRYAFSLLNYWH